MFLSDARPLGCVLSSCAFPNVRRCCIHLVNPDIFGRVQHVQCGFSHCCAIIASWQKDILLKSTHQTQTVAHAHVHAHFLAMYFPSLDKQQSCGGWGWASIKLTSAFKICQSSEEIRKKSIHEDVSLGKLHAPLPAQPSGFDRRLAGEESGCHHV